MRFFKHVLFTGLFGIIGLGSVPSAMAVNPVDWKEIRPAMADATYVDNPETCAGCHEDYIKAFKLTKHGRIFFSNPQNELQKHLCEACHGPLSKHILAPRNPDYKASLKVTGPLTAEQRNSVCLQCHEKGMRMDWKGSPHESNGLSCTTCHYLSERISQTSLLIKEDPKQACFQCHVERRAQMMRSSHMPLRESKLDCTSCHNPHGGAGPSLLKAPSVNEICYTCHAEKRGPMIWEHPPVRENCTNCHEPHGSNLPTLLKMKVPWLCESCHDVEYHPATLYNGTNLPGGPGGTQHGLLGKACLNCHSLIHGSNHPSGARFQR